MLHLRLALLSTVCLLPVVATPALAARAGVTAAVNQSAVGTPPGGGVRTVVLGADVVTDEKIDTTGQGLVQILLADGTTFTVGPNSSLTIDRFVYDPNAGTAQVSANLAKGVFRFIGGRTSKTPDGVQLSTPVGTVGIRGAVADINLLPSHRGIRAQIDLLFGKEITLSQCQPPHRPGHPQQPPEACPGGERIYQPGYSIIIGADGKAQVVRTPPGSTNLIQLALAGRPGHTGGSRNVPSNTTVASSGVPPTNSNHPPSDNTPPPVIPLPPPSDFGDVTQQANADDTHTDAGSATPTTPPPPVDDRPSGTFTGFAGGLASGTVETCGTSTYGPVLLTGTDTVDFSPSTSSLGGTISVNGDDSSEVSSLSAGFGDGASGGTSTYTDPTGYGATGASGSVSTAFDGQPVATATGGTGTTFQQGFADITPCTCAFLQWGSWATNVSAQGESGPGQIDAVGTWAAGNMTQPADFDAYTATQTGVTATYTGEAMGYIQQSTIGGESSAGTPIAAAGTLNMQWNFGDRSGSVGISNFTDVTGTNPASLTFSVPVSQGGLASGQFGGSFSNPISAGDGYVGSSASVNGGFANSGTDAAAGVAGNFTATETDAAGSPILITTASGVFVGAK